MPTASELPVEIPKILLFGGPGTWKTSLVMTLGAKLQLLITDRSGWSPAKSIKDPLAEERMKVDIIPCYEDTGLPGTGLQKVKQQLFRISDEIRLNTYKHKAVCIDSLTTLGEQAMRYVLSNSGLMDHGAIKLGTKASGIGIQHWGLAMQEVENCLSILRSLPILGICIAHDDTEMVDGQPRKIISVIGSKLAPKVPSFFDEVWYSNCIIGAGGVSKVVLQTQISPSINARSRNGLPNFTDASLGLPAILAKIGYVI